MYAATDFVRKLFGTPGYLAGDGTALLDETAAAHANLLARACHHGDSELDRALAPICAFLGERASAAEKRRLLCHPLFIQGLHGLAAVSPTLRCWHDSVTATAPLGEPTRASLGNVALAVLLRTDRDWQGECALSTDVLGRNEFPFTDWSISLRTDEGDCLADRAITVTLDRDRAWWRLGGPTGPPFLVLSRADCLRLVVENDDPADRQAMAFPDAHIRPRLQRASLLGHSKIHYDPVAFQHFSAHAGVTGGLVQRVIAAIRINSPAVYRELRTFLRTVRGFEFPRTAVGSIASFSDPTLPGVMGFAVAYTDEHEPCFDPLCFTWFGHEMGHTKDYFCETVLYAMGQTLLLNPAERTPVIPRYGRVLAVRSLVQVPYVHLYEWALLMDFWEAGFHGLPWRVPADVAACGEDLGAEIAEAFALIPACARLTPAGEAAIGYFHDLFEQAQARWRRLRARGHHRCS
ncbi:MAG: hypothetical protein U0746_21750 [Gemmataceae bacterium]